MDFFCDGASVVLLFVFMGEVTTGLSTGVLFGTCIYMFLVGIGEDVVKKIPEDVWIEVDFLFVFRNQFCD